MRLVDLLLSPRQQSYGVSTNESHYRHPLGAAYLRSKNSEELKSSRKNLEFYRRQDSVLSQPTPEKSFRSTSSLSDLLRSKKSPTSPGYWNHHPTVNPSSSSETLRFAQLSAADLKPQVINGFVKQEIDEAAGFTTTTTTATRGCFDICSDDRQPFLTMDKTLNGNIWNREELSSSSSSTRFFPSLSSSSPSSASSLSSLGLEDRAFNRRRVSLLSSDGSELEPEQILSLATDSDGYESLSSPLEAVDAAAAAAGTFRWTEHAPDSLVGYLDWHGSGGGGGGEGDAERSGYDIDACPLFNFNFLENTLDDCPFESFDTKDSVHRYDNSSFCDSPMVSMVPDVMTTEALKNCGSFSDRDDVRSSFRDHLFKLDELDRRTTRHGMRNNDGGDLSDFPPSASVTAVAGIPAAPVSNMETLQQSEVVKLLLQNRHQWAVPQEKVPSPSVGCRGSRKRASATNGRDVGRAKVPREARPYNDGPSNEEISLSFAPSVRTNSFSASGVVVGDQDRYDHSSSLEKLITELMLFESTNRDTDADPSMVNARRSSSETSATALPYVELFTPSLRPSDLFDGLATCRISDTELFSSLDLESVYLSDCEPLSTLGEGLDFENVKCFEAFVKTEPEKAPFLSLPPSPSSLCQPDSFGRPANWLNGEDDVAASHHNNNNCPTIVDRNKSSVLERILQTNLLFDSLDCSDDSKLASAGREGFISDHDYCQNLDILSLNNIGALDLTCDQGIRHEKRRKCATEITTPICYQRRRDYSALKSLLLDSNLTEEVRKEVELDRAKSRKKMAEKSKATSVNDPAVRLQRLGKIREDRILKQHLENHDPFCGGDFEKKDRSCEEKCSFDDQNIATDYYSPAAEILRRDFDSGTAQPELGLLLSAENSESGFDNTLVTSDLELSGSDDAVFFNSFEDFYNKNQSEIELMSHQSTAKNCDQNDDPMQSGDSLTKLEPKVKRNKGKHLISSKRFRIHRSLGRSGLTVARIYSRLRRPPTGTNRALIRTGKGRSVYNRTASKSTQQHLRAKSPPISNDRSTL